MHRALLPRQTLGALRAGSRHAGPSRLVLQPLVAIAPPRPICRSALLAPPSRAFAASAAERSKHRSRGRADEVRLASDPRPAQPAKEGTEGQHGKEAKADASGDLLREASEPSLSGGGRSARLDGTKPVATGPAGEPELSSDAVTTAAASTQNAGIKPSSISDPAPAKSESSDEKGEAESHEIRPYMYEDGLYANYPRSLRELATRAAAAGAAAGASASSLASSSAHASSSSSGSSSRAWTRPKAPSKEELLRLARGFWTRLRIRFKWFTIRGFRRFNVDDLSAFFTLGGLGTIIFLVAGTTTAVSLVFAALNSLNLDEWIARKLADYLTAETGVTVIFESAIVPKWSSSRICFQNVFISRRAHFGSPEALRRERSAMREGKGKGRGTARAAGHGMAWEGTHFLEREDHAEEEVAPPMSRETRGDEGDGNFTMFDLNVDSIEVSLSFRRWWDGKGLLEDAVVKGVRGIIDRRNVHWDPEKPYDPRAARREPRHGDFHLTSLELQDLLVTVYQPGDFRPFNYSIFNASVPRLRKQWLFYDLLSADSITGQVDGCLFSLHKPQRMGRTTQSGQEDKNGRWQTLSRVRIDGVSFDHIQNQSDLHGPISWITSGKFDIVADLKFPRDHSNDVDINAILSEIVENLTHAVSGEAWERQVGAVDADDQPIPGQHALSGPAIEAPVTALGPAAESAWRQQLAEREAQREKEEAERLERRRRRFRRRRINREMLSQDAAEAEAAQNVARRMETEHAEENGEPAHEQEQEEGQRAVPPPAVVIDLDVRFRDIKAAVPLFHSELGYRTQTFVRPIVAFMNANKTLIPVHCRVVMDLDEFNGSMDLAQTGLLPQISEKIYEALANHVTSQQANGARLRNVSSWSLRVAAQGLLQLASTIRDGFTRTPTTHTGMLTQKSY